MEVFIMKKKFNGNSKLVLVLVMMIAIILANNLRLGAVVKEQEADMVAQMEKIERYEHTIKEQQIQISQYEASLPFEKLQITAIQNASRLERDEKFSNKHFNGTMSLIWQGIPNASGYQIEFNYCKRLEEVTDTYYYRTGAFYSYDKEISEGLKFRIRAYKLQDGEKIYGEFSEWTSLGVK